MTIKVRRQGATISTWTSAGKAGVALRPDGLMIVFALSSAGGGTTDVECIIEPESFEELCRYMMVRNPIAATRAFSAGLMERDKGDKIKDAQRLW